jgi:hypothetical protein
MLYEDKAGHKGCLESAFPASAYTNSAALSFPQPKTKHDGCSKSKQKHAIYRRVSCSVITPYSATSSAPFHIHQASSCDKPIKSIQIMRKACPTSQISVFVLLSYVVYLI